MTPEIVYGAVKWIDIPSSVPSSLSLSTQLAFRKVRFTLTLDSLKNFTSFKYFSRVSDVSKGRATGKYPRLDRRLHRERSRVGFSSMKLSKYYRKFYLIIDKLANIKRCTQSIFPNQFLFLFGRFYRDI